VKWVPAPSDAEEMLKLHLARRRLNGAKADDLVFVPPPGGRRRKLSWSGYRKERVEAEWKRASTAVGVTMSWYQATRHTVDFPFDALSSLAVRSRLDVVW
jgi:hypothetical protein